MRSLLPVMLLAGLAWAQTAPTSVPDAGVVTPVVTPVTMPAATAPMSALAADTQPAVEAPPANETPLQRLMRLQREKDLREGNAPEKKLEPAAEPKSKGHREAENPAEGDSLRAFRLLTERNIFLSTRRAPRPVVAVTPRQPDVPPPPPPPHDPRTDWVFRGSINWADQGYYAAVIEDLTGSETIIALTGQELLGQRIDWISLDQLALIDSAGKVMVIEVSQNLVGQTVASLTPAPAPATPSVGPGGSRGTTASSPAGAPVNPVTPPTGDAAAALLERMRQRRLQEQGRGQ